MTEKNSVMLFLEMDLEFNLFLNFGLATNKYQIGFKNHKQ